jgi:hypothetical protein
MNHDEEEKKHTRRGWKILGGLTVALLVFAAVILVIDDSLEDNSALLPSFTPGGGKENALAVFTREILANPVTGYLELPTDVKAKKPGTEPAMRAFVDKQTEPRKAFDKLMASDPASWRWPDVEQNLTMDANVSYLAKCQELANMQSLLVRALAHEGKPGEAVTEALHLAKCGNGMLHAEGSLIHWLVAITAQCMGEAALEQAMTGPAVTPDLLRRAQEELARLEVRAVDLGFSYRVEVSAFRNTLLRFRKSGMAIPEFGGSDAEALLFKPHRTINAHQNVLQPVISATGHADGLYLAKSIQELKAMEQKMDARLNGFHFSANDMGDKLLAAAIGSFGTLNRRALSAISLQRQTLIMLALRRFELEKGKLPASFDELVPQYLTCVPQDPFDNASMRWSATKQIIYSVGTNLKDEGGNMEKYGRDTEPDIGLRYWWAPPEPEPPPSPVVRRPRPGKPASTAVPSAPK